MGQEGRARQRTDERWNRIKDLSPAARSGTAKQGIFEFHLFGRHRPATTTPTPAEQPTTVSYRDVDRNKSFLHMVIERVQPMMSHQSSLHAVCMTQEGRKRGLIRESFHTTRFFISRGFQRSEGAHV